MENDFIPITNPLAYEIQIMLARPHREDLEKIGVKANPFGSNTGESCFSVRGMEVYDDEGILLNKFKLNSYWNIVPQGENQLNILWRFIQRTLDQRSP